MVYLRPLDLLTVSHVNFPYCTLLINRFLWVRRRVYYEATTFRRKKIEPVHIYQSMRQDILQT